MLCIRPAALRNLIFYSSAILAKRKLTSNKPTILHVHGDWSDFILSKALAKAVNAKIVVASIHDRINNNAPTLYRWALSHCKLVFTTGKAEQEFLQGLLNRPTHHIPSAPQDNFFDLPASRIEKKYDVISVGNFFHKKRQDIILECAIRRPNIRFAICGEGPEREKIIARATAENVKNVSFPGRCSSDQVISAMQSAKVFLSTAEREGTPTAALEAMAVGLPVILTPSNQYNWLVTQGVNGFVTDSWEIDEIVAKIDDVLSNESRRSEMGRSNRERALKHSWGSNALHISKLMEAQLLF